MDLRTTVKVALGWIEASTFQEINKSLELVQRAHFLCENSLTVEVYVLEVYEGAKPS